MTQEDCERAFKEVRHYEREHLGIKFGENFAEVGKVLKNSEEFKALCNIAGIMGLMQMIPIQGQGPEEVVKTFNEHNPFPDILF
jgi:hypothetical protein